MIEVRRTGRVFSFSSVEFAVTFPDGSQTTLWSPPWQMDEDGVEVSYDDPQQDAGAIKEAERLWGERR